MNLKALIFSLLSSIEVNAQAMCATSGSTNQFCLFSKEVGHQIEFQLESYVPLGWIGVGLGSSMKSAEIYVAWSNENKVFLSRRLSTGERDPIVAEKQLQTLVSSSTKNGLISIIFRRDKEIASQGAEVSISPNTKISMIYAYTPASVDSSSPSASIAYHGSDRRGMNPAVDLFASSSAFNGKAPPSPVDGGSKSYLLTTHAFLLSFAWCVASPAGIFTARFLKQRLGTWWFKLHMALMLFGVTIISIIGVLCVGVYIGSPVVNLSKYSGVGVVHVVCGAIVLVLASLQVCSGFIIDKLFDVNRKDIPLHDKFHWWAGRVTSLLGYLNVLFGILLYGEFGNNVSIFGVLYGTWTAGVAVLYGIASVRIGQTHDVNTAAARREGYNQMNDEEQ